MSAKYGVGLLGAGWVAGEYVKVFRDHPLTEVVGIYNRTPGKASRLLQTHGVAGTEYPTLDNFFADERIQIVVSCTHPDVRADHCIRAAQTGRHIVIEKPVALSRPETAAIREAVAQAGVKTVTSFVLRWNPQFVTVRKLIDDGVLGDLIYGEADYWHPARRAQPGSPYMRKDVVGSAFLSGGCHAVDMLRYLGGEVREVSAFAAPPKRVHSFEFDPVVVASVKFANDGVGKLSALLDGDTPYRFNCRLFGTNGSIQNNEVYSSTNYPGAHEYWSFPTISPNSGDVTHHPFKAEIEHFLDCIENDIESHASIYDSYKSVAICFAIDESVAKGGQPVKVISD
ncbi:MAG TPA: Gfo/Idh/MocA family oxidoreductase [Caldilineaceae bacterium]|nr:Gfo/Idh/MocA family oxidoreductase [Caldilineaceae bacterium]